MTDLVVVGFLTALLAPALVHFRATYVPPQSGFTGASSNPADILTWSLVPWTYHLVGWFWGAWDGLQLIPFAPEPPEPHVSVMFMWLALLLLIPALFLIVGGWLLSGSLGDGRSPTGRSLRLFSGVSLAGAVAVLPLPAVVAGSVGSGLERYLWAWFLAVAAAGYLVYRWMRSRGGTPTQAYRRSQLVAIPATVPAAAVFWDFAPQGTVLWNPLLTGGLYFTFTALVASVLSYPLVQDALAQRDESDAFEVLDQPADEATPNPDGPR